MGCQSWRKNLGKCHRRRQRMCCCPYPFCIRRRVGWRFYRIDGNRRFSRNRKLRASVWSVEDKQCTKSSGAVYPTETNTAAYGPLRKVDMDTWNKWAEAVGSNGVYGDQFPSTPVTTEEELQSLIQQYAYGYNVKAGRTNVGTQDMEAGVAGGCGTHESRRCYQCPCVGCEVCQC